MKWKELLSSERPRPSTGSQEYRLQFERDFDRAIFSTPVKRLQDKAQVFPLDPNDAVRTRLTHSLEVSSVARGLAISTGRWLLKKGHIEPEMERGIEAIAATCGLIHDLGNPPFGHAGEDAVRYWFKHTLGEAALSSMLGGKTQLMQDFLNFEGNAQSLRLVTKLQVLADFGGLNLTYGTLSASCKYVSPSHEVEIHGKNHAKSKPGYFASEADIFRKIREKTGTTHGRNPITLLVEAADDIVYSVADVEDGVKKGILSWNALKFELKKSKCPQFKAILERMTNILKAGRKSIPKGQPDDVYASAFRTAAISYLVPSVATAFTKKYIPIMNGTYLGELVADCDHALVVETLKTIGKTHIYCTPSTLKLELMGRKVISDLMDIFWEGAATLSPKHKPKAKDFPGKAGTLLSENYRRVFCNSMKTQKELPEAYHRLQLLTDYICGMTDSFAKRLHAELTNGI